MVPPEINDETTVPNEGSTPVSDHTLHNQLVIPVSSLDIVDTYTQFLPIISYREWRGPYKIELAKTMLENHLSIVLLENSLHLIVSISINFTYQCGNF